MRKAIQFIGPVFAGMLFATVSSAQQPQQERLLPGEDGDRLQVLFESNQQLNAAVVTNAARVRSQQREIDRLTAELKSVTEKCGAACKEPAKK